MTEKGVELRGCPRTCRLVPQSVPATADDWDTEYLAPILSIRVVADLDEAIDHIAPHSSAHTDAIITEDYTRARRFLREVDSSSVMVNASTRFADGFEYGLGAEIGISTDKFHARGPVGLEGLTSVKFVVLGNGEVRGSAASARFLRNTLQAAAERLATHPSAIVADRIAPGRVWPAPAW